MKIRLKKLFNSLKSKDGKRALSVFIICLMCSFMFWLFIKLSRQNLIQYNYIVKITNISKDYFISPIGKSELQVKYRTTGVKFLFSGMYTTSDEIKIDFSQFLRTRKSGETRFYITSQRIEQLLFADASNNLEVVSIWPDTLFFSAKRAVEKKVPVFFDKSKVEYSPGFKLYGDLIIEPDSVFVRLLESDAMKVDAAIADTKSIKGLEKNAILTLPLILDADVSRFEISPKSVNVAIAVEKYTEKSFDVDIAVLCNGEVYDIEDFPELRLLPAKVSVNVVVALKDYNNITPDMFVVAVDCNDFSPHPKTPRMSVSLISQPENIFLNSITPEKVDYLILK
ncbi:MAG: hypothetical protein KGZ97_03285 [Bacteroidetes bacterium]|nr:hypothetical protein [Bacteroidota bacterium]